MQILINLVPMVIGLVSYVLLAVGLHSMAKRRGIRNAWLAWIPIANAWVLGCLSDQYQYVAKGRNKSRRKVLLTLGILTEVVSIILLVVTIVWFISFMGQMGLGELGLEDWLYMTTLDERDMEAYLDSLVIMEGTMVDEYQLIESLFGGILGILGVALLMIPLGIWYSVLYYMALYDLFASSDPKNSTVFLLLSIFIGGIVSAILVLVCKDRDDGMPPRQVVPPVMQELPQTGWQQRPE